MKKNNIKLFGIAIVASLAITSCSDEFLQEKKNYDSTNEDAYNYFSGASGRVGDIYLWCLPDANATPGWKNPSVGASDDLSKCTEEYSGFGVFVDPQKELTYQSGNNPVPDYFQGQANNIQQSAWGRIRNCNDVIRGITNSSLSEEEKNQLLGQVYFFRAWCYYLMVKWYGGVPIIEEVQDPVAESVVPRSTTKQCIDFICKDLDRANELLAPFTTAGGWASSDDYGRVTSGTALALKGRVLLLYASPLFNRANDKSRWETAYNFMTEALPVINSCGYGLANESAEMNAANWANMFVDINKNPEAVFVTLYNTIEPDGVPDYSKNNGWEQGIRPSNALGGGGKTPSAMLVDMFPMADGKRPSTTNAYSKLTPSSYTYDAEYPFMNRDPRFYRTFAFPGVRWTFNGDPRITGNNNNPYNGTDYQLWNYVWYNTTDDRDNVESGNTFGSDNLLSNAKGFYIRKRTDDYDINKTTSYVWDRDDRRFGMSAAPYMEIRYAEVLLNYAEAACGAGHMDVAVDQLQKIRARVGYTAENNYGLQSNLTSDQAACMAAILYERQIELAYEGKRFDDMRRWMLFDGGTGKVEGAPASWTLTGWDGNTCTYLGFPQMNGQRRENLEFRVKNDYKEGLGGREWPINGTNPDPLYGIAYGDGATGEILRDDVVMDLRNDISLQQDKLKDFYSTYLTRKKKKGDSYDSNHSELYINYRPYYYLLGFTQGAQTNNPTLEQTIGWGDHIHGGANGTFDPLAE